MNIVLLLKLSILAFNGLMIKVIIDNNHYLDLYGAIHHTADLEKLSYQKPELTFDTCNSSYYFFSQENTIQRAFHSGTSYIFPLNLEHRLIPVFFAQIKEKDEEQSIETSKFEVANFKHGVSPKIEQFITFTEILLDQKHENKSRKMSLLSKNSQKNEICRSHEMFDNVTRLLPWNDKEHELMENLRNQPQITNTKDSFESVVEANKSLDTTKKKMSEVSDHELKLDAITNRILSMQLSKAALCSATIFSSVVKRMSLFAGAVLRTAGVHLHPFLGIWKRLLVSSLKDLSFDIRVDSNPSFIGLGCSSVLSTINWLFLKPLLFPYN